MPLIRESHPHLAPGYARLYGSAHAPQDYTAAVLRLVDDARMRWELPRMPSVKSLQPASETWAGAFRFEDPPAAPDYRQSVLPFATGAGGYPAQLSLPLAA